MPGGGGDPGGLGHREQRVDHGQRRAQPRVADAGLHLHATSTSSTQIVVLSEPVPVVVGTATSGLSGVAGAWPPPTGSLT